MSNPYELRFSMLMEAKNLLVEEYHAKREELVDRYHALKDAGDTVEYPTLPEYPTYAEVESLCDRINAFVSKKK